MFPHKIGGMDAALDLMSDLDWFGNDAGYLVVVEGLGSTSKPARLERISDEKLALVLAFTLQL